MNADVLGEARNLCEGGASALDALPSLVLGGIVSGKVGLASGTFFSMAISAEAAQHGLIISAKGKRKNDRFRVLTFDKRGDVKHMAEARPVPEKNGGTNAQLCLTPYPTLSVGAPFPSVGEPRPIRPGHLPRAHTSVALRRTTA